MLNQKVFVQLAFLFVGIAAHAEIPAGYYAMGAQRALVWVNDDNTFCYFSSFAHMKASGAYISSPGLLNVIGDNALAGRYNHKCDGYSQEGNAGGQIATGSTAAGEVNAPAPAAVSSLIPAGYYAMGAQRALVWVNDDNTFCYFSSFAHMKASGAYISSPGLLKVIGDGALAGKYRHNCDGYGM